MKRMMFLFVAIALSFMLACTLLVGCNTDGGKAQPIASEPHDLPLDDTPTYSDMIEQVSSGSACNFESALEYEEGSSTCQVHRFCTSVEIRERLLWARSYEQFVELVGTLRADVEEEVAQLEALGMYDLADKTRQRNYLDYLEEYSADFFQDHQLLFASFYSPYVYTGYFLEGIYLADSVMTINVSYPLYPGISGQAKWSCYVIEMEPCEFDDVVFHNARRPFVLEYGTRQGVSLDESINWWASGDCFEENSELPIVGPHDGFGYLQQLTIISSREQLDALIAQHEVAHNQNDNEYAYMAKLQEYIEEDERLLSRADASFFDYEKLIVFCYASDSESYRYRLDRLVAESGDTTLQLSVAKYPGYSEVKKYYVCILSVAKEFGVRVNYQVRVRSSN